MSGSVVQPNVSRVGLSRKSKMLRCTVLVAIGANLPGRGMSQSPQATCILRGRNQLSGIPGLRLTRVLRPGIRSTPVPPSGQPDYVNGVVRNSSGEADPQALLETLQVDRGKRWPRPHPRRTPPAPSISTWSRSGIRSSIDTPIIDLAPSPDCTNARSSWPPSATSCPRMDPPHASADPAAELLCHDQ